MADDDDYNPDALDDEAQEDDGRSYDVTKERIIALIDADSSMLETLAEGEDEKPYLSWAVEMVTGIMQDRIRTSPRDEFGVIFYSTDKSSAGSDRSHEHVYEYLPLQMPSARIIRQLAEFDAEEFQSKYGCCDVSSAPGQAAKDLKLALTACWDMLTRAGGSAGSSSAAKQQSRVAKTVLLFTNNSNPLAGTANAEHAGDQLNVRAQELGALAVHIEVLPLIQLQDPSAFDQSAFWGPLVSEARATTNTLANIGTSTDSDVATATQGDDAEALLDETEDIESKILRIKGLGLRSSGNRKRPLDTTTWALSPEFKIGIKLYGLVMPAKKPHHTYVTAAANEEVTKTRAFIDADTGAMLTAITYRSFQADAKLADNFPKVTMRNEEITALKTVRPKGLVLLGFKPVSCLRDYHTISPSRFVYPDERTLRGSTAAFVALHAACLADEDDPQMAVCSYVSRAGNMPIMVALLPQPEELDGEEQVVPPGFHLIPLPFKDDIRQPECDPALVARVTAGGTAPPRADAQQVAAAAAMVQALSIDGADEDGNPQPFSSAEVTNTALERHFQVLEALALDEEVPSKEELEDDTEPDVLGISRHRNTLDAFKLAVFGSVEGPPQKQKTAGTKRKADDPEAKKAAAAEYAEHDWPALAAPGATKGLNSLTIPSLKVYLQHHGLRLTGNKAELVGRIQEHVAAKSSGS